MNMHLWRREAAVAARQRKLMDELGVDTWDEVVSAIRAYRDDLTSEREVLERALTDVHELLERL